MSWLLFGVTPLNVVTFVVAVAFLARAALLANHVPARRAASTCDWACDANILPGQASIGSLVGPRPCAADKQLAAYLGP